METTDDAVARAKELALARRYDEALPLLRGHLDVHLPDAQAPVPAGNNVVRQAPRRD
jgi:hypothetical protein